MTRINVVPVEELSDQWLIAEYRELPRVLKGNFSIKNASDKYILGKGHVKWARKYAIYTNSRMNKIVEEMLYRGFKPKFSSDLSMYISKDMENDYNPDLNDLKINKTRLIERYNRKPHFYKWTKRQKPDYLK